MQFAILLILFERGENLGTTNIGLFVNRFIRLLVRVVVHRLGGLADISSITDREINHIAGTSSHSAFNAPILKYEYKTLK